MKHLTTDSWNDYLSSFAEQDKDVYFQEEYLRLYEDDRESAECFVCQDGERLFLFPYLRRRVELLGDDFWDLRTAYGYGGPIVNTPDRKFAQACFETLVRELKRRNFIAGLIRFHPLLENHKFVTDACKVVPLQKTVFIDLTLPEETIWSQIHTKHRNTIRGALKSELSFAVDERLEHLDSFAEIYGQTMGKVQADEFYCFDSSHFDLMKRSLVDKSFIGYVRLDEKIIAAALFLHDRIHGHYHLAGSLQEYLYTKPNNFLIYKTALYLKTQGVRTLHLGGGTSSANDDSLYRFKKRFSSTTCDFYLGKLVLDAGNYTKACLLWQNETEREDTDFFPKYRYLG